MVSGSEVLRFRLHGIQQSSRKSQNAFTRTGRSHTGQIEMGGIQRFLIVETDVREERATTVQAPQQCHVTLTLVARITAAACQQIGQSCKDIVRNIRCLGTQIVIFFQHYFRGIFLIGAVDGVISDPDPFLPPIRLFFSSCNFPTN